MAPTVFGPSVVLAFSFCHTPSTIRNMERFASNGNAYGDHDVGGVGDDGAEDSGNVTTKEGDLELLKLGVLGFWFSEGLVNLGNGSLEGPELPIIPFPLARGTFIVSTDECD